jgi:glycosyltransferase involved in cell wall biosynthesis
MRIAFVPQPLDMIFPPMQNSIGVWTYEIARRLVRSCEVIVYSGSLQKQGQIDNGVHYRRISPVFDRQLHRFYHRFSKFYAVRRPLFTSHLYYLGYALQVANDLRKNQCDIVHLHNFSQFVPIIRAFNPEIKIVLHMHCEWLTQLDRTLIEPRLRKVNLVIGCSDYITEKIRTAWPQFASRCHTVFNGVDIYHFCSNQYPIKAEKENGVKRLLFVGRVSPEKGLHVLIDAFRQVIMRHPGARLEIIGPEAKPPLEFIVALSDDPRLSDLASFYRKSYLAQLQERLPASFKKYVTFSGPVPYSHLVNHYCAADAFVFPSVCHEAFGMPVIEAMACQAPVIATRSGGITEIVEDGKTGLLVEREDVAALAEAISLLLANDDLRRSLGKMARQSVLERFSWDQIVVDLCCGYEGMREKAASKVPSRTPQYQEPATLLAMDSAKPAP